jgi:hypothetical protein
MGLGTAFSHLSIARRHHPASSSSSVSLSIADRASLPGRRLYQCGAQACELSSAGLRITGSHVVYGLKRFIIIVVTSFVLHHVGIGYRAIRASFWDAGCVRR